MLTDKSRGWYWTASTTHGCRELFFPQLGPTATTTNVRFVCLFTQFQSSAAWLYPSLDENRIWMSVSHFTAMSLSRKRSMERTRTLELWRVSSVILANISLDVSSMANNVSAWERETGAYYCETSKRNVRPVAELPHVEALSSSARDLPPREASHDRRRELAIHILVLLPWLW